ncbi:MAG: carbohydrate-binding family 9-like protein [Pyrinomonadaceae bacterium]
MNKLSLLTTFIIMVTGASLLHAQKIMADQKNTLKVHHITLDFSIADLSNSSWKNAEDVSVEKYWSGENAPEGRQFKARLLWSDTALYVRFEARQSEPVVVSEKANLGTKTVNMWDRDVCEIFIAPDRMEPRKYLEFEVAPNGEWIDLTIDLTSGTRQTGWDFISGMRSAAKIEKDKVVMAIKVEWKALGKTPKIGDAWLGNLFRCVGKDPTRGYLAWQPIFTKEPAFHTPEKFGEFKFVA